GRRVAGCHRTGCRRELQGAMEYDSPRRCWQELPARGLSRRGVDGCPDHGAEAPEMRAMRADLHVHTWASTRSGSMTFLRSRDCYSSPFDVYRTARARGMGLVTFTDHDSIDGCLELLDRHPDTADFICGEEVSCRFPDGDIEVHLGVYGMTEALHRDLQPLRGNVFEVVARLREA